MTLNTTEESMAKDDLAQITSLKEEGYGARQAITKTIDTLIYKYQCSRSDAARIAIQTWSDLDASGDPSWQIQNGHYQKDSSK